MLLRKFFKGESGFTLIELLVVIGIIAILSTIGTVTFSNARAKARDSKRVADINQAKSAIEIEAAGSSTGKYPITEPTDLSVLTTPSNTAYCYYVDSNQLSYYLAVLGIEDDATADEGDENSADVDVSAYTKVTIASDTIVCPDTLDCDDTNTKTICYTGSRTD